MHALLVFLGGGTGALARWGLAAADASRADLLKGSSEWGLSVEDVLKRPSP